MRWKIGKAVYDQPSRKVFQKSNVETLNRLQGILLDFLITNYGRSYKQKDLIRSITEGYGSKPEDATITKYISVLRHALGGELKEYIDTDPYRLIVKPELIPDATQSGTAAATRVSLRIPKVSVPDLTAGNSSAKVDGVINLSANDVSTMSKPDPSTVEFAIHHGALHKRIIGAVIETHPHPFLSSGQTLAETGWAPENVSVELRDGEIAETVFDDPFVKDAFYKAELARKSEGKGSLLQEPDGAKYAVVDVSSPFPDVDCLAVTLQRTSWFAMMRARPGLTGSSRMRIKHGSTDPSKQSIPNGAGIQFCALFNDGRILTIHRVKDIFAYPNTWSFSGEEQLFDIDMEWRQPDRIKYALLRTCLEEVFPLARPKRRAIEEIIDATKVTSLIKSMRLWSVFLEEPSVSFQCFAVFDLTLSAAQYSQKTIEIVRSGLGEMSNEGRYYTISLGDAPRLLKGEPTVAEPLFGGPDERILPEALHPTSRYRLLRLLTVLSRSTA